MELIVGTWNQGKLNEMQEALALVQSDVHLVGIQEYLTNPIEPSESGATYYDNALEKARFYSDLLQKPVLADDGGLALAAFPELLGVHTSRFFKSHRGPEKNQELLALYDTPELQNPAKRQLTLHACLVYVSPAGNILSASAALTGQLVAPTGTGGYGFDPIFYVPSLGKTLAQLPTSQRNALSPRIQALQELIPQIKEVSEND